MSGLGGEQERPGQNMANRQLSSATLAAAIDRVNNGGEREQVERGWNGRSSLTLKEAVALVDEIKRLRAALQEARQLNEAYKRDLNEAWAKYGRLRDFNAATAAADRALAAVPVPAPEEPNQTFAPGESDYELRNEAMRRWTWD